MKTIIKEIRERVVGEISKGHDIPQDVFLNLIQKVTILRDGLINTLPN